MAATAMAGTYQRNKFLTLLDNMNQVTALQKVQMDSTGNAMKRYGTYAESTEAKLNDLKNAQEQMWMSFLHSSVINSVIEGLTSLTKTIQFLGTDALQSTLKIVALSTILIALVKNSGNVITFLGMLGQAFTGAASMSAVLGASFTGIIGIIGKLKTALTTLFLTPEGLAFMAIAAAIGAVIATMAKHIEKEKEEKAQVEANTKAYQDLTQAIKENNNEQIKSSLGSLQSEQTKINNLLKQKQIIQDKIDDLQKNGSKNTIGSDSLTKSIDNNKIMDLKAALSQVNAEYDKTIKVAKDAGATIDASTGKIVEVELAESRIATKDTIDRINQEKDNIINQDNAIIALINEYNQLSSTENLNATQKERLSQISMELSNQIKGLITTKDTEGNVTIKNTDLLGQEIKMRGNDMEVAKTSANVKLQTAKNSAQAQIGETTVTYQQIMQRIKFYEAEMQALDNLKDAQGQSMDALIAKEKAGTISPEEENTLNNMARWGVSEGVRASGNLSALQQAKAEIDAIFNPSAGANFGGGGNVNDSVGNYIPSGGGSAKASEDAAKKAEELRKQMQDNVKDVEEAITDIIKKEFEKRKQAVEDEYNARKEALQKEKDLYDQQNQEDDYNKNLKKEQETLNKLKSSEVNAKRDTTLAGQARLKDIQQQMADQQDKIDQMVLDHTRSANDKMFDDKMNQLDKEKDAKEKSLEDQYSDANISKMVNSAMYTGTIAGIGSVEDAYRNFQNTYNNGLTASGKIIEDELISKWKQVQSLINGTSGVSIGINFGTLPKYDVGSKLLTSDHAAIVHKNEAIIPASLNPFRGGGYLNNFMNYMGVQTPKMISNKTNGVNLNINTPLINVQGNADSGVLQALNSKANEIIDSTMNKLMKEINNQGIFAH